MYDKKLVAPNYGLQFSDVFYPRVLKDIKGFRYFILLV